MSKYEYRKIPVDFLQVVSAEVLGKELARIESKYGSLKPEYIVNEAAKKRNPLHKCFEWDDTAAAAKWRERQAASMIRVLVVHRKFSKAPVRAFISVTDERDHLYKNIDVVVSNDDYLSQQYDKAINELDRWMIKWEHLKDLQPYFDIIKELRDDPES